MYVYRSILTNRHIQHAVCTISCDFSILCVLYTYSYYTLKYSSNVTLTESFRSAFTLNVKWSCDLRYDVNVHRERQL